MRRARPIRVGLLAVILAVAVMLTLTAGARPVFAEDATFDCANTEATGIPETECDAIIALYNDYGGAANFPSDWLTGDSPCDWGNIGCFDGHIAGLSSVGGGMTGPVPDLSALTELVTFRFNFQGFTGEFPAWIAQSTTLQYVYIGGSDLTGTIPDLSGMTALKELFLWGNNFTGGFPTGVGHAIILIIQDNQLSGPIPDLSGTSLRAVMAAGNDFTGKLPKLPPWIEGADFARNHLKGQIPSSYGLLPLLVTLDLSGNRLTGEVPGSIGDLQSIGDEEYGYLDLGYNRLTASDPELIALLKAENPAFFNTQTFAPTNFAVSEIGSQSAVVSWTRIKFKHGPGRYEVGLSSTPGSGYVYTQVTANKKATGMTLTGLAPGRYYAVVRTVSEADEHNPNVLTSAGSNEITFIITGKPGIPVITAPMGHISDAEPVISWTVNADDATNISYWIRVIKMNGNAVVDVTVNHADVCAGTACAVDLGTLPGGPFTLPAKRYTVKIRATNAVGLGKAGTAAFKVVLP